MPDEVRDDEDDIVELEVDLDEDPNKLPEKEGGDADTAPSEAEAEPKQKPKNKSQERIDQLTRRRHDAERERDEAYHVAQRAVEENKQLRERAFRTDSSLAQTSVEAVKAKIGTLTEQYKDAFESGETDKAIELQGQLARLMVQEANLEAQKRSIREDNYKAPAPEVIPQQPVDTRATDWADENPWFNKDHIMTGAALSIHEDLVNSGVDPASDAYYEKLDAAMRENFPHKFTSDDGQEVEVETPRRQTPPKRKAVVAPSQRSSNSGGKNRKTISLSATQRSVAERLGVPLEVYAKHYAAQMETE
jgi:hypothetical protein|tara:strand:+ start:1295 stop:2209 length:915 start_codon:yes stop_codon:yes gene_type:complete